jgi:general secretion pathway protein G
MLIFQRPRTRYGMTLPEVLILMMVFAIMAATVLPQFTAAHDDALEAALRENLKRLRSQIELYRFQHKGNYPGKGSQDSEDVLDALLLSSDADGSIGPIQSKPFGPYFTGQLPANPYSGGTKVRIVPSVSKAVPDDDPLVGWLYNPANGKIKANSTGTAADGTPLDQL